jgi:1,2-diacylglycerol 3-alpha-glucosyltransferase
MNLIPNAIDLEAFDPNHFSEKQKTDFKRKYGIPEGKTLVVFVGRLGKEKSVDVLLEYWANTITPKDGLHLVVVGEGPDKKSLELLAEGLNVKDTVTFTGLIKHDKIPECFAACDIYVTASLSDTNSISMLEGMASGLPVLERYDENNTGQIENGVNGYSFNTAQEMAARMKEIRSMSKDARETLKAGVIASMVSRGAAVLAEYMLDVYAKAKEESRKREARSPHKARNSL